MPSLEKLVVRASTCTPVLAALCALLAESPLPRYPALQTLVFSVLHSACALEELRPLFDALERRAAALGYRLQNLILCSPLHVGPDYSAYGLYAGAEWVTFSSMDAGSSMVSNECQAEVNAAAWGTRYEDAWDAYPPLDPDDPNSRWSRSVRSSLLRTSH
ncbi:hypothetical protein BN946_scf185025.g5 [Trametes cinnabarina]|uniref:Uncharacterized protein n=1 Tax=Pycnoporus cinnabarinus TaxID=5643 RepID=A0A060STA6_PYCCI|nr:hypothetical protein BN946_scf185025.g5 [Trametes cinnabarina]